MKEKEITEFKLKLASLTVELEKEHLHWKALLQYGCQDPFWSDGVNMYLTRNLQNGDSETESVQNTN